LGIGGLTDWGRADPCPTHQKANRGDLMSNKRYDKKHPLQVVFSERNGDWVISSQNGIYKGWVRNFGWTFETALAEAIDFVRNDLWIIHGKEAVRFYIATTHIQGELKLDSKPAECIH